MTRKHFQALAEELRYRKPYEDAEYRGWLAAVAAVADTCKHSNSNFDRDRFYAAAGVAGYR